MNSHEKIEWMKLNLLLSLNSNKEKNGNNFYQFTLLTIIESLTEILIEDSDIELRKECQSTINICIKILNELFSYSYTSYLNVPELSEVINSLDRIEHNLIKDFK